MVPEPSSRWRNGGARDGHARRFGRDDQDQRLVVDRHYTAPQRQPSLCGRRSCATGIAPSTTARASSVFEAPASCSAMANRLSAPVFRGSREAEDERKRTRRGAAHRTASGAGLAPSISVPARVRRVGADDRVGERDSERVDGGQALGPDVRVPAGPVD
jgi:hypothetical protein